MLAAPGGQRGVDGGQAPQHHRPRSRSASPRTRGSRDAILRITRHLEGAPQDLRDARHRPRGNARFPHQGIRRRARDPGSAAWSRTASSPRASARPAPPAPSARRWRRTRSRSSSPATASSRRRGKPGGFSAYGGRVTKARCSRSKARAPRGETLHSCESALALRRRTGHLPFSASDVRALSGADRKLGASSRQVGPFRLKLQPPTPLRRADRVDPPPADHGQGRGRHRRPAARDLRRPRPLPRGVAGAATKSSGALGFPAQGPAVKDLAAKVLDGTVPTFETMKELDDDALVERLTAVRGIGRWTVEMLLMFRPGSARRPAVDDYGIRKGVAQAFRTKELPTPGEVLRRGERWRPFRTLASWYLARGGAPRLLGLPRVAATGRANLSWRRGRPALRRGMRTLARLTALTLAAALPTLCGLPTAAHADEGMWPFNMVPKDRIQKEHGVTLTDALARARAAVERSFRQRRTRDRSCRTRGLVLTNHHVASDCIGKLARQGKDYFAYGYIGRPGRSRGQVPGPRAEPAPSNRRRHRRGPRRAQVRDVPTPTPTRRSRAR